MTHYSNRTEPRTVIDLEQHRLSRRYAEMVADPQPFGQPRDFAEPYRSVPPIPVEHIARALGEPLYSAIKDNDRAEFRVSFGERLVSWGRDNGDLFVAACAGAALGMLVTVGLAYVWAAVL